ncbi:MAG: ABC transporter substrate-binding protein [Gammaproteobacteria bacterium]
MRIRTRPGALATSALGSALALGLALMPGACTAADGPADGPIVIGLPLTQSGPVGVVDHEDHLNGTQLAIEEVNAAGGVLGRMLEVKVVDTDILTPEGTQAAFQKLVDEKVHAISSPFVLVPNPAMDVSAAYGVPHLSGDTKIDAINLFKANPGKHANFFHVDPPEIFYGKGFLPFLDNLKEAGNWKPINNKIHIVQEQIAYNQRISEATQEAIAASKGAWELAGITDIQSPVQDWGPVIQDIHKFGAGVVMLDHWVAAEYAAFTHQYQVNPLQGSLVYMQYGPSQPEFLDIAGEAAEGYVWSTVLGVYNDEQGAAFRKKYKARFPGTMGLVYTGMGYDVVYMLKAAWEGVGDPNDFNAVNDYLRANHYRGVNGWYMLDTDCQCTPAYPDQVDDVDKGMAHLFFQVQDGEHKIIAPVPLVEAEFRPAPWMQ